MRGRLICVCDSNMSSKCVKLQLDSPLGPNSCPCKTVWDEVWNQVTGAKVELEEDIKWRGYEGVSLEEMLLLMSASTCSGEKTNYSSRRIFWKRATAVHLLLRNTPTKLNLTGQTVTAAKWSKKQTNKQTNTNPSKKQNKEIVPYIKLGLGLNSQTQYYCNIWVLISGFLWVCNSSGDSFLFELLASYHIWELLHYNILSVDSSWSTWCLWHRTLSGNQ